MQRCHPPVPSTFVPSATHRLCNACPFSGRDSRCHPPSFPVPPTTGPPVPPTTRNCRCHPPRLQCLSFLGLSSCGFSLSGDCWQIATLTADISSPQSCRFDLPPGCIRAPGWSLPLSSMCGAAVEPTQEERTDMREFPPRELPQLRRHFPSDLAGCVPSTTVPNNAESFPDPRRAGCEPIGRQ